MFGSSIHPRLSEVNGANKSIIGGVSLQRSIVWIPLERRTFDILHLLHPDLIFVLISAAHVMLLLRFLNRGIKAKAARRRGGQPRPTPYRGSASLGQPPCSVGHPRPGQLQAPAGCSRGTRARWRSAMARHPARGDHPQGQQPTSGRPAAGATPARRSPAGRSTAHCQRLARKGLLARGEAVRAAPARGQPIEGRRPQRHLCRGSSDGGAEGEYGVRASFG
ncbi:hypothetical protein GW17_00030865 [Ensete ventricosum]|nr:hypothetical protein GW17_00030865 [Ensete ventricosum]